MAKVTEHHRLSVTTTHWWPSTRVLFTNCACLPTPEMRTNSNHADADCRTRKRKAITHHVSFLKKRHHCTICKTYNVEVCTSDAPPQKNRRRFFPVECTNHVFSLGYGLGK